MCLFCKFRTDVVPHLASLPLQEALKLGSQWSLAWREMRSTSLLKRIALYVHTAFGYLFTSGWAFMLLLDWGFMNDTDVHIHMQTFMWLSYLFLKGRNLRSNVAAINDTFIFCDCQKMFPKKSHHLTLPSVTNKDSHCSISL